MSKRNNFAVIDFQLAKRLNSILIIASCLLSSCGIYSFSGASIAADVKTVSILNFPNQASLVVPTLSQKFTERLRDKFVSETNLNLVKDNGDLQLEGAITRYEISPIAATGNEVAASVRLSITVQVDFINLKDEKQNWQESFTKWADYPSTADISAVENELIENINEQLADAIFNKAVVNW